MNARARIRSIHARSRATPLNAQFFLLTPLSFSSRCPPGRCSAPAVISAYVACNERRVVCPQAASGGRAGIKRKSGTRIYAAVGRADTSDVVHVKMAAVDSAAVPILFLPDNPLFLFRSLCLARGRDFERPRARVDLRATPATAKLQRRGAGRARCNFDAKKR